MTSNITTINFLKTKGWFEYEGNLMTYSPEHKAVVAMPIDLFNTCQSREMYDVDPDCENYDQIIATARLYAMTN